MKRLPLLITLLSAVLAPASAEAAGLRAGVGKADITPQTGYYLGGWTRADRVAGGQHTRLFSRAMVLERNGRKVALVQVDLFMIPGGMVQHIGEALAARGFSERNILISGTLPTRSSTRSSRSRSPRASGGPTTIWPRRWRAGARRASSA